MKVTLTGLLYRPQMSPQSQKSLVYLKHLINNLVCLPLYKYRTIPFIFTTYVYNSIYGSLCLFNNMFSL